MLYRRRGSRDIQTFLIKLRDTRILLELTMKNTADVTGGKPIANLYITRATSIILIDIMCTIANYKLINCGSEKRIPAYYNLF
jgi:hypothetical protein